MMSSFAAKAVPISPLGRRTYTSPFSSPSKSQQTGSPFRAKITGMMSMPPAAAPDRDEKKHTGSSSGAVDGNKTTTDKPKRQKSSSSSSSKSSKASKADAPPPVAVISTKVFTFSKRHSLSHSSSPATDNNKASSSDTRQTPLDPIFTTSSSSSPAKGSAARGKRHSISQATPNSSNNIPSPVDDYTPRITNKKVSKRHSLSHTTSDIVVAARPTTTITTSSSSTPKQKKVVSKRHSLSHAPTIQPNHISSSSSKPASSSKKTTTTMGKRHSMSAATVSSPERDETHRTMGSDSENSNEEVNAVLSHQQQQQLLLATPRRMTASWLGKLSSTVRGVHTSPHGEGGDEQQQQGPGGDKKVKVVKTQTEQRQVAPSSPASSSATKKSSKQISAVATGTLKKKKTKDAVAAIAASVIEPPPPSTPGATPKKKKGAVSSTGTAKATLPPMPISPLSPPKKEGKPKGPSSSSLPIAAAPLVATTPASSTTTTTKKMNPSEEEKKAAQKTVDSPSVGSRTSKNKKNDAKEAEETEKVGADGAAPLPLSFVLAPQQKRRSSIDSRVSVITECTFMSINKIDSDLIMDIAETPPPPTTRLPTKRTDLRVRFGNPDLPVYNRQLRHDDCVVVPEFFGPEDNWWVYEQLIKEFDELEKRLSTNKDNDEKSPSGGWKPCPSHLGKYLTWSSDPCKSQTFSDICEKVCEYFRIDPKTSEVAMNWYQNCDDMQTPRREETAFKDNDGDASTIAPPPRNITVLLSFGAEREITLEKTNATANAGGDEKAIASITIPQTNNGMFTIGRDVNIRFQHALVEETDGLAAAVAKHQILAGKGGDGGRIGILISGQAQDALEEPGSPRRLSRRHRIGGN